MNKHFANFLNKINVNCPTCLYCHEQCSKTYENTSFIKYKCQICNEIIILYGTIDVNFSCLDFLINTTLFENDFKIEKCEDIQNKKYISSDKWISIPQFEIDFSNKEKLYNKLKTYMVFV